MNNFNLFIKRFCNSDLLLDTNLLILLITGDANKQFISKTKATKAYTIEDYYLLKKIRSEFNLITTPHVLTETSNLCEKLDKYYKEPILQQLIKAINELIETINELIEIYAPSADATITPVFLKLGLTDSMIYYLGSKNVVVLTEDFDLYSYMMNREMAVENINHLRSDYILHKK